MKISDTQKQEKYNTMNICVSMTKVKNKALQRKKKKSSS